MNELKQWGLRRFRCCTDLNTRSARFFWFFETCLKTENINSSMSRWRLGSSHHVSYLLKHSVLNVHSELLNTENQIHLIWASFGRQIQDPWENQIQQKIHRVSNEMWMLMWISSNLSFSSFDSLTCFLNHCAARRSENIWQQIETDY